MRKSLLFAVCLGLGMAAYAQTPSHQHYVLYPENGANDDFASKYHSWEPGKPLDARFSDDEEFFISRVKQKDRFTYAETQVDPQLNSARRFLWWVPMGQNQWNAVPTYFFNSEVFNMWSYIDHWGNWTAPVLRAPAAYLDICHKNGVSTSVVAAIAWAARVSWTEPDPHGPNIKAMVDGGAQKLMRYLRYYGIDGVGYNSEFNTSSEIATAMQNLFADCHLLKEDYGVDFSVPWYSLTGNGGSMIGGDELSSSNDDWFWNDSKKAPVSNYFFPNYNWYTSQLQTSQTTANSKYDGGSWNVYMGMDMQGRDYANWTLLEGYDVSFGMWGAHNMNMLFESRGELGSSGSTPQETYLTRSERFFTGGTQNPVNPPAIANNTYYSVEAAKNFHGISSFITARSVLQGDLATEPFVTYFNLGNGYFFNVNGETTFNNEWYNVGIQDYMPTWRWWWTKDFMGRTEDEVPETGLTATFTWDDAWFGGSCMRISGSTDGEYLQLFKTKYDMQAGDKLTIRYKLLSGSVSMQWAVATEQNIKGGATNARIRNTGALGDWQEATVEVGSGLGTLNVAGQTLALIGLHFSEAENLDMLIGEISLTREDAVTPAAPVLRRDVQGVKAEDGSTVTYEAGAAILDYTYQGATVKLVWSMGEAPEDEPWANLYNSDVNAWYYKVYVQQEQGEPVMCTATTSWAAYVVNAPVDPELGKLRVGVSAVSVDGKTESDITWSDYMELPEPTTVEGIVVDKAVIKPNEEFTVSFQDPNYPAATRWEIRAADADDHSEPLLSADNSRSITGQLEEIGLYDVAVTDAEGTNIHRGLVQISGNEVGAVPQIESVAVNDGTDEVQTVQGEPVTYSYVGRDADGSVSRALMLQSNAFSMDFEQFGFNEQSPFTVAWWCRPDEFIMGQEGVTGLSIRNPKQSWPHNNWGYMWQDFNEDYRIQVSVKDQTGSGELRFYTGGGGDAIDMSQDVLLLEAGRWYHICIVFDYSNVEGRICTVYVNGKNFGTQSTSSLYRYGNGAGFYLMFGGYAANRTAYVGAIDEFQVWDKALTAEEAAATMQHQTNISDNLIGYWDFETEAGEENYIYSTGSNKDLRGCVQIASSGDGGEGDQNYTNAPATYDAGAPFLTGIFDVTTVPDWGVDVRYGVESNEDYNATEGSVDVTYNTANADGYAPTLTLTNSWGSDSMTFPVVVVATGLDEVDGEAADAVYPNPFENELYIAFKDAGAYTVDVYSLAGNLVSSQAVSAMGGEVINVRVNAEPGSYIVKVVNAEGKTVRTAKVIKK